MPSVRRRNGTVRVLTGVALAGALLLSGCGGEESGSSPTTTRKPARPATTTAQQTGERKPAAATIAVDDMKFSPAEVTIKVGDTVTWKFGDKVPHTVQGIGDKAMGINSPIIDKGEWSYTFTTPGAYRYLCSLHPEMRGTVTVE
ncbi:plastocyanin/azurin family copper-binding protein [Nocardia arthritidis]|uniref:plastocyanin/azurin family copper-binding protein n=1 Tax=Nocardia arthritidis TaxID=228602 RepID=UPI0007A4D029|nr:plastocyanin/azurin family copper-binding protein [Nocardia arthritidis]